MQYRVALRPEPAVQREGHRPRDHRRGRDDRDRRLVRLADHRSDLHTFDTQFGFPDPCLQIDKFGNVPPFDPTNSTMVGWAEETSLDVEYAHSIAPGAKIILAETPVAETEGTTGFPEMMAAEDSLIKSGPGRRDLAELRRHREHLPRLQQR